MSTMQGSRFDRFVHARLGALKPHRHLTALSLPQHMHPEVCRLPPVQDPVHDILAKQRQPQDARDVGGIGPLSLSEFSKRLNQGAAA